MKQRNLERVGAMLSSTAREEGVAAILPDGGCEPLTSQAEIQASAMPNFQNTLEEGRSWIEQVHRLLAAIMIRRDPTATELAFLERITGGRPFIQLIPMSFPELAEPIVARRVPYVEELGRLARRNLAARNGGTEMFCGATGHMRLRHRVEYFDPEPEVPQGSDWVATQPVLVIVVIADLPQVRGEPHLASCLVCYDEMN